MRRITNSVAFAAVIAAASSGCDLLFQLREIPAGARDPVIDALVDARVRFGTPRKVMLITASSTYATNPTLTADRTELLYTTSTFTGSFVALWVASQPVDPYEWRAAMSLMPVNTPKLSPDGMFLAASEGDELRAYRRAGPGDAWSSADAELGGMPSAAADVERPGTITADGRHMVMYRRAAAGEPFRLYAYRRDAYGEAWIENSSILEVLENAHPAPTYNKLSSHLTADGLTLLYSANKHASTETTELWIAHRVHVDAAFEQPRPLNEINDPGMNDGDPWLSPDRSALYFSRSHPNSTTRTSEWGVYLSVLEPY